MEQRGTIVTNERKLGEGKSKEGHGLRSEQFRRLVELSPDLIAIHSDGILTYMNPAGIRMAGCRSYSEVVGHSIAEFVHPDDRQFVADLLKDLYGSKRRRRSVRFRFVRKDGTFIHLEISSVPLSRFEGHSRLVVARDVTEVVRAEETLKASEEHLRLFVEGVKEYAMYTMDTDGNVTSWNRGAERLKGYGRKEIIGKNFSIFFPPEAAASGKPYKLIKEAAEKGQASDEGWHVKKDGTYFWASTLLTAMRDARGTLKGFSKITRDLTEEKAATDRLVNEVRQLQALFGRSHAVMFLKDVSGRYIRVNEQFEHSFGVTAKDVLGKTDRDMFPPDQADEFRKHDREVIESGVPLVFEESARYEDGTHVSLVVKYPLMDEKRGIYAIGGVVTDITHLKSNEELLRTTNRKLEAVLNAAPLAILTVDRQGKVLTWNGGAEQMFGWTKEEVLGRVFPAVPPGDLEDYLDGIARGFKGESCAGYVRERMKKDGTVVEANIARAPVTVAEGQIESIIIVIDDVTDRRRTARELEESHMKLRLMSRGLEAAREQDRKRISLEIHDELGQMLTALKMDLSLLLEGAFSGRPLRTADIGNQLTSSLNLVDNAIDTVRKIAADLRPGILDHLGLEAAIMDLGRNFEKRSGITCKLDLALNDLDFGQDESIALYRIVQEALTNVARHSGAGIVNITAVSRNGTLAIDIKDNGKGISADDIYGLSSFGIFGMRERASGIGATLTVSRRESGGTLVSLKMPVTIADSSVSGRTIK